jgi:hypothetical protein
MINFIKTDNHPTQRRFIDGFSFIENPNQNYLLRSLMGPFFNFNSNGKLPNIVTPGGYNGSPCFELNHNSTTNSISISPGYAILNETLFEFPKSTIIELNKTHWYIDTYVYGEGTTETIITRFYICIVYSPTFRFNNNIIDRDKACIGIITNKNLIYNNPNEICVLGVAWAYTSNRRITNLFTVTYTDYLSNPLIRRPYPDALYNIKY